MTALGDRLVIMLIAVTGLAGLFAWWSGWIEGALGGSLEWLMRGVLIIIFLLLVAFIWRRSRVTKETHG